MHIAQPAFYLFSISPPRLPHPRLVCLQPCFTCLQSPYTPPPTPHSPGFLIRDWFVYAPNYVGLMFAWYYTFSCFKFSTDKAQDAIMVIMMSQAGLFFLVGLVQWAANVSYASAKTMW